MFCGNGELTCEWGARKGERFSIVHLLSRCLFERLEASEGEREREIDENTKGSYTISHFITGRFMLFTRIEEMLR